MVSYCSFNAGKVFEKKNLMQVHAKLLDHRKRVRHFSFMGKEGAESWRE